MYRRPEEGGGREGGKEEEEEEEEGRGGSRSINSSLALSCGVAPVREQRRGTRSMRRVAVRGDGGRGRRGGIEVGR